MIFLVYTDPSGDEVAIKDDENEIIYFEDLNDLNDFVDNYDPEESDLLIHQTQRSINLKQCVPSHCHYITDPLPDFLASKYEYGSGNVCVIDTSTGEILSKKYCIVYADESAGYFVARYGESLLDKNNEFILYKNNHISIVKEDLEDTLEEDLKNLS